VKNRKYDSVSRLFARVAFDIHPKIGELYESHMKFFNDGLVELICLIITNSFIAIGSYYFIGLTLAFLSFCFVTPITFAIKYLLHKFWVWNPNE